MNCPACGEPLQFRTSARSPTKYGRCTGCGSFINFSKRATAALDTQEDRRSPADATQAPPQPGPEKSLYEKIRDGEL